MFVDRGLRAVLKGTRSAIALPMNTKKPTLPTAPVKQLDKVEGVALENVVGGCACGCAMPNCNMQMAGRRWGWR